MSLAEGQQAIIVYNPYASGVITPNLEDQAPPPTAAQVLRRVSSTLDLAINAYTAAEIRQDRQIVDYRHGVHHVGGDIAGELSPLTYFPIFSAVHRDTPTASLTLGPSVLTSMACNASASTITFAGGNPVTAGLSVGDVIRFTGGSTAANMNRNFWIKSFGGSNNRILSVTPPPATQTADISFSLERPGKATAVPSSSFVSRKFGLEVYHEDLAVSRLFTESRFSKYAMALPATGLATFTATVMGRSMLALDSGSTPSAPYFTTPNAETDTEIVAAVNGQLLLEGTSIGVVTGVTMQCDLNGSVAEVVGQNFPAEVFLGRANVTGQVTAFLEDTTILDYFTEETELQILLHLDGDSSPNCPAIGILLPRIKLGTANVAITGEAGQIITSAFQALKYVGSAAGVPGTTIRIVDTEAV